MAAQINMLPEKLLGACGAISMREARLRSPTASLTPQESTSDGADIPVTHARQRPAPRAGLRVAPPRAPSVPPYPPQPRPSDRRAVSARPVRRWGGRNGSWRPATSQTGHRTSASAALERGDGARLVRTCRPTSAVQVTSSAGRSASGPAIRRSSLAEDASSRRTSQRIVVAGRAGPTRSRIRPAGAMSTRPSIDSSPRAASSAARPASEWATTMGRSRASAPTTSRSQSP
jgi:hypothetical protein